MKENITNISVLVPSLEGSKIPSLGYSSIESILAQTFPGINVSPTYLDSISTLNDKDILIANLYSTLGFIDLLRTLNNQGFSTDKKENPFTTIISGTGALNPLPIKDVIDFVVLDEKNLVKLISDLTKKQPQPWELPNPIWAKTDYITLIMPTLSCTYDCIFCQLKRQNGGKFQYSDLDKINKVISKEKPSKILIHSANILQYPFLDKLLDILEESRAEIYFGSMNLIDINKQVAEKLFSLSPKHTIATEKDTDVQLYFGLETGSDRVLKEMKKPLTRESAIQKVQILRDVGFSHPGFYLIVGYPNTNEKDYSATADMLNTMADIMGSNNKITIKCTPFLPHLATEVSQQPAKYWFECIKELNFIKNSTRANIDFEISDSFYYLTNIVLIRGDANHSRLLQRITDQKDLKIENDEDMETLLKELNLPNLKTHLKGKAPLDLSLSSEQIINSEDL